MAPKVFGPNDDPESTSSVIAACKRAQEFDDMPTVPIEEADAVVAAFIDADEFGDWENLSPESVGVCRVPPTVS